MILFKSFNLGGHLLFVIHDAVKQLGLLLGLLILKAFEEEVQ